MSKHKIIVSNVSVNYEESRPNNKEIVLFIHGLGGDHRGLLGCSKELKNFHSYLLDLPGYGNSQALKDEHSLINYANFIEVFRNELNINKFYIVSHSFGTSIAKAYAKMYPGNLKGLVLLNPILEPTATLSWRLSRIYANISLLMPDSISHFMFSNKLVVYITDRAVMTKSGKKYRKEILNQDYENYKKADIRALKDSVRALDHINLDLFGTNKIKTMIIFGESDSLVNSKNILANSKLIKNTKIIFHEGGHLLPLEDPTRVGRLINNFLES